MSRQSSKARLIADGLSFEGIIDHQTIPTLIDSVPKSQVSHPVLDLSAVSRIDSAGLAFLMRWGEQHLQQGEKIILRGTSKQARQLIDTMKLEELFEFQPETR